MYIRKILFKKIDEPHTKMQTADGRYWFSDIYYGKKLEVHVDDLHKYNSDANGWGRYELIPGLFGFDCLAHACARTFKYIDTWELDNDGIPEIEFLAGMVHDAWVDVYVFWRGNKPWETSDVYKRPKNKLGDERRDGLCVPYAELPPQEKAKDVIIAEYFLRFFK
jgi:hypothetical protein